MKSLFSIFFLLIPVAVFIWFVSSSRASQEVVEQKTNEVVVTATPTPWDTGVIDEKKLWTVINDWKEKESGYRYRRNEVLCKYSKIRADELYLDNTHSGFSKISKKILSEGGFYKVSENIQSGSIDSITALNGWLNSQKHREALEENYTNSCVSCYSIYCVQLFGK